MKKNVFLVWVVSIVLVVGFLISGCGSTPSSFSELGIYDSNISEDQLVTLEIAGGLKVVVFNETSVSWGENGINGLESKNTWRAQRWGNNYKTIIKIPAGNHTLQANLYLWDYSSYPGIVPRSGYVRANGLNISYDFQPGCTYFLRPVLNNKAPLNEKEMVEYNGSYAASWNVISCRLRLDENNNVVAEGNIVSK